MKAKTIVHPFMIKTYNVKQISCGCHSFQKKKKQNIWNTARNARPPTNHKAVAEV